MALPGQCTRGRPAPDHRLRLRSGGRCQTGHRLVVPGRSATTAAFASSEPIVCRIASSVSKPDAANELRPVNVPPLRRCVPRASKANASGAADLCERRHASNLSWRTVSGLPRQCEPLWALPEHKIEPMSSHAMSRSRGKQPSRTDRLLLELLQHSPPLGNRSSIAAVGARPLGRVSVERMIPVIADATDQGAPLKGDDPAEPSRTMTLHAPKMCGPEGHDPGCRRATAARWRAADIAAAQRRCCGALPIA
jgi:hypothetical protein